MTDANAQWLLGQNFERDCGILPRPDGEVWFSGLAPTRLELAGAPAFRGIQGRSLLPVLRGDTDRHRDALLIEPFRINLTMVAAMSFDPKLIWDVITAIRVGDKGFAFVADARVVGVAPLRFTGVGEYDPMSVWMLSDTELAWEPMMTLTPHPLTTDMLLADVIAGDAEAIHRLTALNPVFAVLLVLVFGHVFIMLALDSQGVHRISAAFVAQRWASQYLDRRPPGGQ